MVGIQSFPFGAPIFRGKLAVSFREGILLKSGLNRTLLCQETRLMFNTIADSMFALSLQPCGTLNDPGAKGDFLVWSRHFSQWWQCFLLNFCCFLVWLHLLKSRMLVDGVNF